VLVVEPDEVVVDVVVELVAPVVACALPDGDAFSRA
jgi:hypothetical protein